MELPKRTLSTEANRDQFEKLSWIPYSGFVSGRSNVPVVSMTHLLVAVQSNHPRSSSL
jgi:hypothetical protein